jgi:predicted DCC family thiol-disulfide oxidoreductase YuxK
MPHPLLLYDGVCGFCNRFVQFVLRHDKNESFRFASLQSQLAARILSAYGASAVDLDTVYVIRDFDPEKPGCIRREQPLLSRSDAILFVLRELGWFWSAAGFVLRFFPRFMRNAGYHLLARSRYRIFGKHATCPLPDQRVRSRFLDL